METNSLRRIFCAVRNTVISATFALLVAGGCSAGPKVITESGINNNVGVGEAENKMILLNVARAYQREPRVYTDFSGLTSAAGTQKITLSTSPTAEFDSPTQSNTFVPNDTQAFMYGITSPVPAKTIEYLSQQAWPNSTLLHLIVRDIKVYDEKRKLAKTYSNYPQATTGYNDFDGLINALSACNLTIENGPPTDASSADKIGPTLAASEITSMSKQADMYSKGVELVPALATSTSPVPATKASATKGLMLVKLRDRPLLLHLTPSPNDKSGICESANKISGASQPGWHLELGIRSPDAILYYLGEVVRVQFDGANPVSATTTTPRTSDDEMEQTISSAQALYKIRANRGIGVVQYAEACFYDGYASPDCTATCKNLFVMNMDHSDTDVITGKAKAVVRDRKRTNTAYCTIPMEATCATTTDYKIMTSSADFLKPPDNMKYCQAAPAPAEYKNATELPDQFSVTHARVTLADATTGRMFDDDPVVFSISGDYKDGTETMHVLAILEELIGLQTTSTTAPVNSSLTVVIDQP